MAQDDKKALDVPTSEQSINEILNHFQATISLY